MSFNNIMVTGADGFIGRHLVDKLSAIGYNVCAIGDDVDLGAPGVAREAIDKVQPDVIFHLAALVGVDIWTDPRKAHMALVNNCAIDACMASAISNQKYRPRVFYASSSEVYSGANQNEAACAGSCLTGAPREGYALSKLIGERLFNDINLRFFNVVGAKQRLAFAIPAMVMAAINNDPIKASKDYRSFCAIEDAVSAMVALLRHDAAAGTYNIGNPNNYIRMDDMADLIRTIVGSKSYIDIQNDGYCKSRKPDITKLQQYYSPRYGLEHIVTQVYKDLFR